MKYTEQQVNEIIALSKAGLSSRQISNKTGASKSGINYLLEREDVVKGEQKRKPNILFLDLETAPSVVATFGRFKQNHGIDSILKEGGWLITLAWQWQDEDEVYGGMLTSEEALMQDDSRLVGLLWELYERADVVVTQNGLRFDHPTFKTRCIINGFPPPKTVKQVDTLKIAKTLKFNSNRLDSLGKQLQEGRKVKHDGMDLWVRCISGDEDAIFDMLQYNKGDISLLRSVYERIKAYDANSPQLGQFFDDNLSRCPVCGSANVEETGHSVFTPLSEFKEVKCNDCGHRARARTVINSKEKRANLLMTPK